MTACLIVSAMADDRPGLVESLSSAIKDNNGNWLESRMAHMAGKFAGIVRIQVPASHQESLKAALNGLADQGWTISIEDINEQATTESGQKLSVSIVGNDRPGIVQEVSAVAKVLMPSGIDADDVIDRLENISNDLMVETQSAD